MPHGILAWVRRQKKGESVSEQRAGGEQRASLQSERGRTTMSDTVVAKIAGIAALEVEGIQMGSGSARTRRAPERLKKEEQL
jgi:hypothetical protein